MGESRDDAPGRPERADGDDSDGQSRGFFSRFLEALNPTEEEAAQMAAGSSPVSAIPVPGILNLRRMRVEDVSVPEADITAVPVTLSKDELVEVFRESGMTRLPVYEGTLDSPLGFVNLKDFALKHGFGNGSDFDLRGMLRPLLYVPPSMPLGVLLTKMQAERTHMALVIDEYGGTDGLVTIEDLLETVVGEIEDEHDIDEAQGFVPERPGQWLALARTPLDEFETATGLNLTEHDEIDEEEVDSLGGLVVMLAGHVPARGEVIRHPDGPEFEVVDADPRRIKRLRVRLSGSAARPAE
ncbi:hemolysin family protein [Wenxinia saemankumensis]|uniref:Magnesium and cobalt transporter n=1 Tax=Wenxinia saemankumensis TaxID=1447782 RepID=A0A1M6E7M1_9RHOB|nr:hemolysin family protein [Wenxinia saemankumensis]SHI81435.1 magnesium and cobalt transporter [Wenxinia saemankumensis]